MASKPRPSLLDLFDPLLADAVKVPIPESPPMTPQKPRESSVENKENLAPNEVTMSVFFNRISRSTHSPAIRVIGISSGPLVDLGDAEVLPGDGKEQVSHRVPLTELSLDDFALALPQSLNNSSSNKRYMSPRRLSSSEKMSLPSSPLCQTQLASSPPTAISMNDSFPLDGSLMPTTRLSMDSAFPPNLDPPKESLQTSSSKGLLFPDQPSNPGRQPRRRSSIEISTALSSLSSASFHMPDTSFDLVNGEISFLTKSSDGFDMDHDVQVDSWEPTTPLASPQTLISKECPIGLSKTRPPCDDILLATTSTRPSIGNGEFSSEYQLDHGQFPRQSGRTTAVEDEPAQVLDTIRTAGQDTPPSARRVSSVPAPMKKLRVFTSKHHQISYATVKRGTAETLAASSRTSYLTSKHLTHHNSGIGCVKSCDAGVPRGSAAKGPVISDTVEQPKGKPAASGVKNNIKAPSRSVRSLEVSVLHKEEPTEASSRLPTVSRLPGPARARGGTIANQGRYGRLDSTQRGRSVPLRSNVRSGASSKDANRIPER